MVYYYKDAEGKIYLRMITEKERSMEPNKKLGNRPKFKP